MIDILIDKNSEMISATNRDVLLVSEDSELLQNIKIEAMTYEGDCFYESEFGWSLLDFIQVEIDDLTILEIKQRVKDKLKKHTEINQQSVSITITEKSNILEIRLRFETITSNLGYEISINLDRINAEVVAHE